MGVDRKLSEGLCKAQESFSNVLPQPISPSLEVVADACGFRIGAVLLQEGPPVAFENRGTPPAECHIDEQELLAVVHCYREEVRSIVGVVQ